MKNLFLTLTTVISIQSTAAELPANLKLRCTDGTFAHNELAVDEKGGVVTLKSSAVHLEAYKHLLKLDANDLWGRLEVSVTFPKSHCRTGSSDSKIIVCTDKEATLNVTGKLGNTPVNQQIVVKEAVTKVRKISEVSIYGNDSSGYELSLAPGFGQDRDLITQQYFTGLSIDQSANCQIEK